MHIIAFMLDAIWMTGAVLPVLDVQIILPSQQGVYTSEHALISPH